MSKSVKLHEGNTYLLDQAKYKRTMLELIKVASNLQTETPILQDELMQDINEFKSSFVAMQRDFPELWFIQSLDAKVVGNQYNWKLIFSCGEQQIIDFNKLLDIEYNKIIHGHDLTKMSELQKQELIQNFNTQNMNFDLKQVNTILKGIENNKTEEAVNASVINSKEQSERNTINVVGGLIFRSTICCGQASTIKYLCDRMGLKCISVLGERNIPGRVWAGHWWNMIQIQGKWYQFEASMNKYYQNVYFNLPTCAIESEFRFNKGMDICMDTGQKEFISIYYPECTSYEANQYELKGRRVTEANAQAVISKIFHEAMQKLETAKEVVETIWFDTKHTDDFVLEFLKYVFKYVQMQIEIKEIHPFVAQKLIPNYIINRILTFTIVKENIKQNNCVLMESDKEKYKESIRNVIKSCKKGQSQLILWLRYSDFTAANAIELIFLDAAALLKKIVKIQIQYLQMCDVAKTLIDVIVE